MLLLTNMLIWNLFLTLIALKDRTTTFEYTTWSVTMFQSRFWQENPCFEQGAQPWNLTLLAKFGDNNKQVAREQHTLNKAGAWSGGLDEKPCLRVRLLGREDHLPVHQIVCVLHTANLQELHFLDVVQDCVLNMISLQPWSEGSAHLIKTSFFKDPSRVVTGCYCGDHLCYLGLLHHNDFASK